jgi:hypothetical protein
MQDAGHGIDRRGVTFGGALKEPVLVVSRRLRPTWAGARERVGGDGCAPRRAARAGPRLGPGGMGRRRTGDDRRGTSSGTASTVRVIASPRVAGSDDRPARGHGRPRPRPSAPRGVSLRCPGLPRGRHGGRRRRHRRRDTTGRDRPGCRQERGSWRRPLDRQVQIRRSWNADDRRRLRVSRGVGADESPARRRHQRVPASRADREGEICVTRVTSADLRHLCVTVGRICVTTRDVCVTASGLGRAQIPVG